jgi:2-dehydro-3-deoxy-D-gluconate 5-dehydrogenase
MLEELFSLAGRVALVTGGNGGLGRAIALGLRAAGARVAVTGRDVAKNAQVAEELGSDSAVLRVDVRSEEAVAAAVSGVVARLGHLDILVNNAGVVLSNGPVTEMPRAEWDAVIETNLTGAFLCAKHAARAMVRGGRGGKIINIASIYACYGPPDFAHYPSAKPGCSD